MIFNLHLICRHGCIDKPRGARESVSCIYIACGIICCSVAPRLHDCWNIVDVIDVTSRSSRTSRLSHHFEPYIDCSARHEMILETLVIVESSWYLLMFWCHMAPRCLRVPRWLPVGILGLIRTIEFSWERKARLPRAILVAEILLNPSSFYSTNVCSIVAYVYRYSRELGLKLAIVTLFWQK